MNNERFRKSVEVILTHEGGYVHDPNDLGGETNFGISKQSYPNVDIKKLTKEKAMEIYYRDWWVKYKYGDVRDLDVAIKVFDLAVNMGPTSAHRILQKAVNFVSDGSLKIDGVLGPLTLGATNRADPQKLQQALRFYAAEYYHALAKARPANRGFLLGWLNRAYF